MSSDDDDDDDDDALQTFLASRALSHLHQKLLEFGIDSLEALKYERDVKGLCEDIGFVEADAIALEKAQKSLEEEKKKKTDGTTTKTGPKSILTAKEAIEQAKLAARARNENVGGDGHQKLRESLASGLGVESSKKGQQEKLETRLTKNIAPFEREEVEKIIALCEEKKYFALFKLPKAPVDELTGKCEWRSHPATSGNAVLLESKMMQLRLTRTITVDASLSDVCERCEEEIRKVTRIFSDQKLRNAILKREVERRVEELIAEGHDDLEGGFVTVTGIHYGTGAAAAAAKEAGEGYSDLYADEGPRASSAPGARLPPSTNEGGTDKIDRLYEDLETNTKNSRKIEDVADHNNNNNNNNTDSGVDLEAIRNKLKRKKPKFM
jgi:hypothetical protein